MILKEWIKTRLEERSTMDGVIMIVAGAAIMLIAPLSLVAYAMIAYGAWTIWKPED